MRIQSLTMSAFGSYGGVNEISFNGLHEGLFLVTGDTGAGKTTVFDAITYALYGESSGGERQAAMMRSQYASPQTETFVSLTFSCEDGMYTVRRNPEYTKLRTLKNGSTKETKVVPKVELFLPDGSLFIGKKTETEEKITELVGLNKAQFTQIVMIAQGDFLKLLYASSDDRKKIFARLFGTETYWKVERILKEQTDSLYDAIERNDQSIRQAFSDVSTTRTEEKDALLAKTYLPFEEMRQFLTEEIVTGEKNQRELGKLRTERRNETEKLKDKCNKWKEIAKKQHQKEETALSLQNASETEQQQADAMGKWQKRYDENQAERTKQLLFLRDVLPDYEICERLEGQKDILTAVKDAVLAAKAQQVLSKAQNLLTMEKELGQKQSRVDELAKQWSHANDAAKQAATSYEKVYTAFLHGQAGVLASTLKEGKPCPVCGSPSHPMPAALHETVPSQEMVERAKREREDTEKKRDRCQEAFQQETLLLERASGELSLAREKAGLDIDITTQAFADECAEQARKLLARQKESERNLHTREQKEAYKEKRNQVSEPQILDVEIAKIESRLHAIREKLTFPDAARVRLEIKRLESEETAQRKELEQKQAQLAQAKEYRLRLSERLDVLTKELRGKSCGDIAALSETLSQAEKMQKETEKELVQTTVQNERNKNCQMQLERFVSERMRNDEKYQIYDRLYKTACGKLAGSSKLDLETYVQRFYFRQIIAEANRRLLQMSGGQFVLRIKELSEGGTRKNEGLDLAVYSIVTDTVRDVRTLSGGEAFMAALSMALGLSDVIERESGAIRPEIMFVDEGFGSLDENARDQAVSILGQLSGGAKLVGIISHVTELKDQIDQRLCVVKTRNGSSAHWN